MGNIGSSLKERFSPATTEAAAATAEAAEAEVPTTIPGKMMKSLPEPVQTLLKPYKAYKWSELPPVSKIYVVLFIVSFVTMLSVSIRAMNQESDSSKRNEVLKTMLKSAGFKVLWGAIGVIVVTLLHRNGHVAIAWFLTIGTLLTTFALSVFKNLKGTEMMERITAAIPQLKK
jgi:hypothetical protein